MPLDNALDADEYSSQRYINEISNNIDRPPKVKIKEVPADHEILGLHLTTLPTPHFHRKAGCFPVMGIAIDSRLSAINLTPTHTTNLVNVSGHKVEDDKFSNKKWSDIERSYYVLSKDECKRVLDSGAYDSPNTWNRKLNDQMRGFDYNRLTRVRISTYHAYDRKNNVGVIGLGKPAKGRSLSITMVSNDEPWNYFSDGTDNSFSFLLDSSVKHITRDYLNTGSRFRINHAMADYGNRKAVRFNRYLSTGKYLNSNDIETDADLVNNSQRNLSGVDSNGYVDKYKLTKAQQNSIENTHINDHVTKKQYSVKNEVDLDAALDKAFNEDQNQDQSETNKMVTKTPHAVANEYDLKTGRIIQHDVDSSSSSTNNMHYMKSNASLGAYMRDIAKGDEDESESASQSESHVYANMSEVNVQSQSASTSTSENYSSVSSVASHSSESVNSRSVSSQSARSVSQSSNVNANNRTVSQSSRESVSNESSVSSESSSSVGTIYSRVSSEAKRNEMRQAERDKYLNKESSTFDRNYKVDSSAIDRSAGSESHRSVSSERPETKEHNAESNYESSNESSLHFDVPHSDPFDLGSASAGLNDDNGSGSGSDDGFTPGA